MCYIRSTDPFAEIFDRHETTSLARTCSSWEISLAKRPYIEWTFPCLNVFSFRGTVFRYCSIYDTAVSSWRRVLKVLTSKGSGKTACYAATDQWNLRPWIFEVVAFIAIFFALLNQRYWRALQNISRLPGIGQFFNASLGLDSFKFCKAYHRLSPGYDSSHSRYFDYFIYPGCRSRKVWKFLIPNTCFSDTLHLSWEITHARRCDERTNNYSDSKPAASYVWILRTLFSSWGILRTAQSTTKRRILEGLMIQQRKPSLNRQVHCNISKLFPLEIT